MDKVKSVTSYSSETYVGREMNLSPSLLLLGTIDEVTVRRFAASLAQSFLSSSKSRRQTTGGDL